MLALARRGWARMVMRSMTDEAPIVFFDGHCHLCDGAVQFILDRDEARRFRFAPLQSEFARDLFARHGWSGEGIDSIILFHGGQFLIHSDAVLAIARELPRRWRWLAWFSVLPRGLRDAVYRLIARNRYRIMGRKESCRLPKPGERERFLG